MTFEAHNVTTEDGYILEMHRLFHPNYTHEVRPAVFLQHGLLSSSEVFVLNGDNAAAFKIARLGYDVWMGNNRGNQYSRGHVSLNPKNKKDQEQYFDFSFFELAQYDAPAQIDYVREHTGWDKLSYLGHSQGTTQMFTALSEDFGDMKDKINLFIALAPITTLGDSTDKFYHAMSQSIPIMKSLLEMLGIHEFFGEEWDASAGSFCVVFRDLCDEMALQNVQVNEITNELVARISNMRKQPSASVKSIIHFSEIRGTDKFAKYDFLDEALNTKAYGQKSPPLIDLTKVKGVPISMIVGKSDDLATPEDAKWAKGQIGSDVFHYQEIDNFDHQCFNFGVDQTYLDVVVEQIQEA